VKNNLEESYVRRTGKRGVHKGTHYQKTKAKKNEKNGMEGPQGQQR
jgi:hypothetical protein